MADVNPFEVSESCKGSALPFRIAVDPHWFRVDGNLLVCGASAILPKICYKTGAVTDLVDDVATAEYPTLKIVLTYRKCTVRYSMSQSVSRRRSVRSACGVITICAGICMAVAGESILQIHIGTGILIGLLMIVGGLVDRLFLKPNFKLMRYEAPGYYFVRGFSGTFLARLAEFAEKSDVAQFPINRFPEMPFIERPGK